MPNTKNVFYVHWDSIRLSLCLYLLLIVSCKKKITEQVSAEQYSIQNVSILKSNTSVQLIGANTFHVFGGGSADMNSWNLDVAREFAGNMKESPVTGSVIKDANSVYLYSLQNIVDSNRANKRITILCPFGWDGTAATVFTGKMPAQTFWWTDFKTKLQQWAVQFKNQPDVWLEVWNEPYRYDRGDGYTDDIWMNDMNELVNIIRNTGNNNIILVPCAEQGQDESVLINKGNLFLAGKKNILFDIHAYEKWLLVPDTVMGNRLKQLKFNNLPVFFGETAPLNSGVLMNPQPLLDSIYAKGLSVCAWVWKYDSTDTDALLDANGFANNNGNNNWGTAFKSLALKVRKP